MGKKHARDYLIFFEVAAALSSIKLLELLIRAQSDTVLSFRFYWYAVVPLIAAFGLFGIILLLNKSKYSNRVTFWFSVYLSLGILFEVGTTLKMLAANNSGYIFWTHLTTLSSLLTLVAIPAYVLAYTENEQRLYRVRTWVTLVGGALLMGLVTVLAPIVLDPSAAVRHTWGYDPIAPIAKTGGYLIFWLVLLLLYSGVLLIRYYRRVKNFPKKRVQTLIFLVAVLIPTAGITLTEFLFPLAGFKLLPLNSIFNLVSASLIAFAIVRYGLFSIDPATLSDTILGTMNEAVVTINPDLEVEVLNPRASKMLGHATDQVQGRPLSALFSETNVAQIKQRLSQSNEQALELDIEINNRKTPISLLASKIDNADKSIAGYILVFRDISRERAAKELVEQEVLSRTRELHEEQAKLQASIESLAVGLMLVDPDDKVIIQNTALRKIFDRTEAVDSLSTLNTGLEGFDLEETVQKVRLEHKPVEAKKVTAGAKILRIFAAPVDTSADGSSASIGTVVLLEDITEQTVLDRSKDEFFSIASHELRTPLTSIKGNASMIIDFYSDVVKDKDLREMIIDIHSSSVRLIDIVNDFLDLSRLEQGKMTFTYESFGLDEVIENVVYEMKTILSEKSLYLKFDKMTLGSLPKVWADKNRIKQVVYNLVGNAVKFTEKGGVTISASADDASVKVMVTDTGRGIPLSAQKLLFHKFQQAGSSLLTRDTTRGTGLGLYISKVMLDNMNGQIALEKSEEGKGATFSFTVPLASLAPGTTTTPVKKDVTIDIQTGLSSKAQEPAPAPTPASVSIAPAMADKTPPKAAKPDLREIARSQGKSARAESGMAEGGVALATSREDRPLSAEFSWPGDGGASRKSGKYHLLIIEDDPYVVRLYQRLFKFNDYDVEIASNGEIGLAMAKEFHPRLILLDMMMPKMNGLEVLEALKSDNNTKDIHVVMLTSLDEESAIKAAKALGADDYIIKSDFTPEEVLVRIEPYLK